MPITRAIAMTRAKNTVTEPEEITKMRRVVGKKTPKGNRTKKNVVKDLTVKDDKAVKGGTVDYLKVKLSNGGLEPGRDHPARGRLCVDRRTLCAKRAGKH
jgi:hypothetical protein